MAVNIPTTNFGWIPPTEGASSGTWDTLLNAVIAADSGEAVSGIDEVVGDIKTTADAALSRAGGSMTGEIDILTERYVAVDTADSGAVTLDLNTANFFHTAASGVVTYAFSNVPASPDVVFIVIEISGTQNINWPAEVDWPGGSAPVITAGVDVITGYTRDGGTTWRLALAQSNSS
ncbi:MAG: hypothetical protein V3S55_14915 [Nitrospiraceae bacterium]